MSSQPDPINAFFTPAWFRKIWCIFRGRAQAGISKQELLYASIPFVFLGLFTMMLTWYSWSSSPIFAAGVSLMMLIGAILDGIMVIALVAYRKDLPLGPDVLDQHPGSAATRYDDYVQWRQQQTTVQSK